MSVSERRDDIGIDPEREEERLSAALAEEARRRAITQIPIDTGYLLSTLDTDGGSVFVTAFYAPFVHDGTVNQMSQPFLRDSAMFALNRIDEL